MLTGNLHRVFTIRTGNQNYGMGSKGVNSTADLGD
jgi:hypothetical protein